MAAPWGEHLPDLPSWKCRLDGKDWPCAPARKQLASTLPGTALAMYMTVQLGVAARDMPTAQPGDLYFRFLLWTRPAPPSTE